MVTIENSYGCTIEGEYTKEELQKFLDVGWKVIQK
jgi:hypothetical protein